MSIFNFWKTKEVVIDAEKPSDRTRECKTCKKVKLLEHFARHGKRPDGWGFMCRRCMHKALSQGQIKRHKKMPKKPDNWAPISIKKVSPEDHAKLKAIAKKEKKYLVEVYMEMINNYLILKGEK